MLVRIVRMTFAPEHVDPFLTLFDEVSPTIRDVDGCHHLELWQDVRYPSIITTYSEWSDREALHAYRHSPFFESTWERTRRMFAAPPRAFSHKIIRKPGKKR